MDCSQAEYDIEDRKKNRQEMPTSLKKKWWEDTEMNPWCDQDNNSVSEMPILNQNVIVAQNVSQGLTRNSCDVTLSV